MATQPRQFLFDTLRPLGIATELALRATTAIFGFFQRVVRKADSLMAESSKVLYVGSIPSPLTGLPEGLRRRGFPFSITPPQSRVDDFGVFNPALLILGPSLDRETLLECVCKITIAKPYAPILFLIDRREASDPYKLPFMERHYFTSGLDLDEILMVVDQVLSHNAWAEDLSEYPAIIGQSPALKEAKKRIRMLSGYDTTVLITGETGTGKELVARSLHYHSPRKKGPLIKITCGALPDDLLESEVFGFQKGAFTGAHKDKPGRLELAHEGTLFIDEIGDLSLPLQTKFLQVFEDRVFTRLGGVHDKPVDMRVVAATNSDLATKVRQGQFRKDLFYRLNTVHFKVPPLRDRKEDVEWLIHYFLHKYSFELKRELLELPARVSKHLFAYHWPGNIRELENVIRRALTLRDWGFIFEELKIQDEPVEKERHRSIGSENPVMPHWDDKKIEEAFSKKTFSLKRLTKAYVSEIEKSVILDALGRTHWNRKLTAQALGVSYKTLLTRIDELEIESKEGKPQLGFSFI